MADKGHLALIAFDEQANLFHGAVRRRTPCYGLGLIVSSFTRMNAVPIGRYPRLAHGSPAERAHVQISGAGYGMHWPELDEAALVCRKLTRGAIGRPPPPRQS